MCEHFNVILIEDLYSVENRKCRLLPYHTIEIEISKCCEVRVDTGAQRS